MLHEKGWRTVYIPTELAVGDTPETVEAYTKQQLRWATGGFEIMLTHNPLSPKRNLTMDQRLQYLVTATHYLTGIAPLLLILVPPLQIYFNLTPMNLTITPLHVAAVLRGLLRDADPAWRSTRSARSAGRCSCSPRCRSRSTPGR